MEIVDSGVCAPSYMDFTLPSDFAQNALYYVPQFGHFYCDAAYRVERDALGLFLLIYMCAGTLCVQTDGRTSVAARGQIVLLDCRKPHAYYCQDSAEFLWFHFNGNSSAQYADYLAAQAGPVFAGDAIPELRQCFDLVFSYAQAVPSNEHLISLHVSQILSRLASPETHAPGGQPLEPALSFIREHFMESVSLGDLAAQCNMSPSHFIRSFDRYTGRTPHEYLLAYRLRQAKRLLLTTSLSVEQIAEACGFNSASHFARAFRKGSGMSPSAFRVMQF